MIHFDENMTVQDEEFKKESLPSYTSLTDDEDLSEGGSIDDSNHDSEDDEFRIKNGKSNIFKTVMKPKAVYGKSTTIKRT